MEISGDAKELRVETKTPESKRGIRLSVNYEIHLPAVANLDLKSSNGAVRVEGVQGTIDAHTSNGSVTGERLIGPIEVSTSNGKITLLESEGDARMSTSNGSVRCENVKGSVVVTTSNGGVSCENVSGGVNIRTSNGGVKIIGPEPLEATDTITCHTSNGSIHLSLSSESQFNLDAGTSNGGISTEFPVTTSGKISKKRLVGTVGDGGPEVQLRTSNGSISIKKR